MRRWRVVVACALLGCDTIIGLRGDYRLTDATADASVPDSASIPDAAPFEFTNPCVDGGHALCCDFDREGGVTACWGMTIAVKGGQVTLTDAMAVSSPYSMRARASGDASWAYAKVVPLPGGNNRATCTFDAYIDQLTGTGFDLGSIVVDNDDRLGVSLLVNPLALDGGQGAATFQIFGADASVSPAMLVLPLRTWLRLRLAFVLPPTGNASGTFTVLSFDAGPPIELPTAITMVSTLGFRGGVLYVTRGLADMSVDNVVCDTN